MGGNALKSVSTRRCDRSEFDDISNELVGILKNDFTKVKVPTFYKSKETFGDIDIIVSIDGINMREYITKKFKPNEIFHNGNCYSFDYKNIQIDIITTSDEDFDTTYNYMCGNDVGNLIGKIAHGFGLKYGQRGLVYPHHFKDQHIGDILISKDYQKIFYFLGLNHYKWLEGFNTLEDIFRFISESAFFNHTMFELDSLNKINRDRDKKRNTYVSFLNWMHENVSNKEHEYQFYKDKTKYILDIDANFPEAELIKHIRRLEYEKCKSLYVRSKFSAGKISEIYGYEGKELGNIFASFKKYIEDVFDTNYDNYILEHDEKFLYGIFEIYIKTIKNK